MLGPEAAAGAITAIYAEHLPAKIAELAARLEATRQPLADRRALELKLLAPFDVLDIPVDAYPAVLVVANNLVALTRTGIEADTVDAGQARYAARYAVRTWAWVRRRDADLTPGERGATVDRDRKRLILALREVLLDHQAATVTVGDTPALDPDDDDYRPGYTVTATLDESTLRESYSDVVADDAGVVAAAWLELEVTVDESIPASPSAVPVTAVTPTVVGHPAYEP